jgi:hypothetical protein
MIFNCVRLKMLFVRLCGCCRIFFGEIRRYMRVSFENLFFENYLRNDRIKDQEQE